jgi:hypothetical protein
MSREKTLINDSESPNGGNGSGTVSSTEDITSATLSNQERKAKSAKGIEAKLKQAFKNFPNVDSLWHDGEEVYFSQVKPGMVEAKRIDN